MFTISKKYCCRKMDVNKIFDVSELFRCYFDLFSIFFRCFFSMFSLSMFCLFHVFAFLCFVVLCFVIDPTDLRLMGTHQGEETLPVLSSNTRPLFGQDMSFS